MPHASTACTAMTRGIARADAKSGNADSAITMPPTGSVAAPVTAIRPLLPTSIPGVTSPCTASSAAISEKPPPTITVRVSPRRAPATVIATAATVVTRAVTPTA